MAKKMKREEKIALGVGGGLAAIIAAILITKPEAPEDIGLSDIRIDSIDVVPHAFPGFVVGNTFRVVVWGTNYGDAAGDMEIHCEVNGLLSQTKRSVLVKPGESVKLATFDVVINQAGIYQASVDGFTKSFEVLAAIWDLGVGLYEAAVPGYIAGTIIVDGVQYVREADRYFLGFYAQGAHTINAIIPATHRFLGWNVYDWATRTLIKESTQRPLTITLDRDIFVDCLVEFIMPPEVDELGIMLSNPPAGATHFKWFVLFDGNIKGSHIVPIGEIAEALYPPVPIPSWLKTVQLWRQVEGAWEFIAAWEGRLPIAEYGIYEFNWNTKTLSRLV